MVELVGYSNIEEIGAGGQAKVYSAIHDASKRKVAIKVLLPELASNPDFASRFLRESKIIADLVHPRIIPIYEFAQRDGTLFMAMELLPGGDLKHRIEKGIDIEDVLKITKDVAIALNYAHEKGYVHRDVKPDNVLFRENGTAVLTDFGIARLQNAANQLTAVGQVLGTPQYMSPEQLQDKAVDSRSDIYSLGIMFFEMLTGHAPYEDKDFTALALKHIQAPIPKLPEKFAAYQKVFERMVAKEPDKRFQTGFEIAKLIQQIRSGQVDVAHVESGNAAMLKRTLEQDKSAAPTSSAGPVASNKKVVIPRELMIALQDLDPLIDKDWKQKVTSIYDKISRDEQAHIYKHFLEPKGILLDANTKEFTFYGRKSVQDISPSISNAALGVIAKKVEQAEHLLKTTTDLFAYADVVESTLSLIDRYDTQENLKTQKEKNTLRAAFLDDLVLITRNGKFDLPENKRSLSVEAIRTYIIEVFIKQQMMGYRFKTVPYSKLDSDPNDFIKEVGAQARLRQCDIIISEKHYYLVGPAKTADQNPFSIRRFLQEDSAVGGQVIYFNAVALPIEALSNEKSKDVIRWLLSRIVTLERQLSKGIVDLVNSIEKAHKDQLGPMLLKKIDADGTDIAKAIEDRLTNYEKSLSLLVLGKIPKAIFEYAQSIDDYEFLFFSLRKFIIEFACDVRDFSSQSTAALSDKAAELDLKMMSYLKLLDKRKPTLFTTNHPKEVEEALDVTLPVPEMKSAIEEFEPKIEELKMKKKDLILKRKKKEEKSGLSALVGKIFGGSGKEITPDDIQTDIDSTKHKCMIALIKIRKRYPLITLYLEFEDLIEVDERCRHYAISAGAEGIGRLPLLMKMPEDRVEFDTAKVRAALGILEA